MPNCLVCYKDAGNATYHNKCAKRFFGTANMPELELNNQLLLDLADQTINQRIAVTGIQPKLSVTLKRSSGNANRLTITGLWGEYILKPQHDTLPSMPETEDLTMHLAEILGIDVCQHTLLRASDGSLVYLARRFDRVNGKKIHVEDFCQLSNFLTENKYKGSYEQAGKIILKYCTNTGLDAGKYFELLLFSYLTGNNDMHLKNFSLIHREDNSIALAPAYDLLNVNLVFPKDKEEMALLLGGKKSNIRLTDFEALGEILKIPEKFRQSIYKKFSQQNETVRSQIEASFLSADMKDGYWKIWLKKQQLFEPIQKC